MRRKVIPCAALLLGIAAALPARAHRIKETDGHYTGAHSHESVPAWLLELLFNPAEGKARIRIDAREGYRYIIADGLPNHATGRFPNRGNPNRIAEQSYSFRVPLEPVEAPRATELGRQPFGVALNGGMGGRPGGPPDLDAAARKPGISTSQLRIALGPPPPDFQAAARRLGISTTELIQALRGRR